MFSVILWTRVMIWASILYLPMEMARITNYLLFCSVQPFFLYFSLFYFYSTHGFDASGTSVQLLIYFVPSLSKIYVKPPPSLVCGKWPNWQQTRKNSGSQPIYDTLYSQFS